MLVRIRFSCVCVCVCAHLISAKRDIMTYCSVFIPEGKYATAWKGVGHLKDAITMVVVQQLLWKVKPATIIEMGTYTGGSALWMADIMTSYGSKCCVYTVDIDLSNVHPTVTNKKEDIIVIQGDCFNVEEALPPEKLKVSLNFMITLQEYVCT